MAIFSPFSLYQSPTGSAYDDVWALWDASNGGTTTTTWSTISGSAGTLDITRTGTNVTYVSSGSASHYAFASNEYMTGSLAGFAPSGGGFVFNMWAMPNSFSSPQALYWIDGASGTADFGASTNNNRFQWSWYEYNSDSGGGGGDTGGTTYSSPNTLWFMNTVVWDGVTAKVYVNGTLKNSFNSTTVPYPTLNSLTLRVGFLDKQATSYYLNSGKVAMMELWNRNLSPTEVTELWDTNKTRFGY